MYTDSAQFYPLNVIKIRFILIVIIHHTTPSTTPTPSPTRGTHPSILYHILRSCELHIFREDHTNDWWEYGDNYGSDYQFIPIISIPLPHRKDGSGKDEIDGDSHDGLVRLDRPNPDRIIDRIRGNIGNAPIQLVQQRLVRSRYMCRQLFWHIFRPYTRSHC
jgi:hypothetical protein